MSRVPVVFESRHRARFREMDAYGHMNMAHYLTYFTDHRFEGMLKELDLGFEEIRALPIAFHTRKVEIEYLRPVMPDQEFVIRSWVSEWGKASLVVELEMLDGEDKLAVCTMRVGCIDRVTGRPTAWPEDLKERFFREV